MYFFTVLVRAKKRGLRRAHYRLRDFWETNDLEDQVSLTTVPTIWHRRNSTGSGLLSNLVIGLEQQRHWEVVPRIRLAVSHQSVSSFTAPLFYSDSESQVFFDLVL